MDKEELKLLIFSVSLVLVILGTALIIFFFYFQQKKTGFLLKRAEDQKKFDHEIAKSRIEIREHTLENISWEIHDNVGQLLSIAKMQLNILQPSLTAVQQIELQETSELIGKSLQELRSLAKSLNPVHFKTLGLLNAIKMEIDRFNRMNFIDAKIEINGDSYELSDNKGIILFRIIQEFFNNTMKHSKSAKLCILLDYKPNNLFIMIEDHGVGFDLEKLEKNSGLGLQTMKSRAALIGASFKMLSKKQMGTRIEINCPV